ncbi:MAG: SdrD B-like domain-containing protein [Planctomycetota bacterium]
MLEPLEPRILLDGSIAGTVFDDLDADGGQDPGEPGLPGRAVYLDLDDDGTLGDTEPLTSSSRAGAYEFTGLAAGTYTVRQVDRSGWTLTGPGGDGSWTVSLGADESATGRDFGNHAPPVLISCEWNAAAGVEQVSRIDPDTGAVTTLGELGDLAGWFGRSVLDADHSALYVTGVSAGGATKLYTFDVDLGGLVIDQPLGRPDVHLAGLDRHGHLIALAWDPAGGSETVLRIDPYMAATEELGTVADLQIWRGQSALDAANDRLYAIGSPDGATWKLYTFDLSTGAVTAQPPIAEPELVLGGVDAAGDLIGLAWNATDSVQEVYRVDPATAAMTELAELTGLATWRRQSVLDAANDRLHVVGSDAAGSTDLYTVELGTGAVTGRPALPTGFDAFVNHQTRIEHPGTPRVMHRGMSLPLWEEPIDRAMMRDAIADLAALGATRVAVNVFWFQDDLAAEVIEPRSDKWTAEDSTVEAAIDHIHAQGMDVMLKPDVDVVTGGWRGEIDGTDTWFTNPDGYQAFINHFADMAQAKGVELFCVGTELIETTDNVAKWRDTIAGVRARYDGKLVYAANWHQDRAIDADIAWWDELDYVGIDAYYPLTSKNDPTVAELKAAWGAHVGHIESWYGGLSAAERGPLLFTEIGYRSWDGANKSPTNMTAKDGTNVDQVEQADCYSAVFEELWREEGWLRGAYWWNWEVDPAAEVPNWYPIQDKLAEDVLAAYYGGA